MKQQSGFTLIELIMVIVILGILAATALPKFVDLRGDAQRASVEGLAAAITSGSVMNYGHKLVNSANGYTQQACSVTIAASAVEGGLPAGYTVGNSGTPVATTGTPFQCILTDNNTPATSAVFTVPYI